MPEPTPQNAPSSSTSRAFALGGAGGLSGGAVLIALVAAVLFVISNIQQRIDDERSCR